MSLRESIERSSTPAVERLASLPPWAPLLLTLAGALGGAWLGGAVGLTLVALAALATAWLLYLAWPRLAPVARLGQAAVLLLVAAVVLVLLDRSGTL